MTASTIRTTLLGLILVGGTAAWGAWKFRVFEAKGDLASRVSGLRSWDSSVRVASIVALAPMGRDDPSAQDGVMAALKDSSISVRAAAADTIGKWELPRAAKPLANALKDPDPAVRGTVAYALGKLPTLDDDSATALLAAYEDQDPYVRTCVLDAIEYRARTAQSAEDRRAKDFEPYALRAIKDPAPRVRWAGALALRTPPARGIVDADAAVDALFSALEDTEERVRVTSIMGIPNMIKIAKSKLKEPTLRVVVAKTPALVTEVINGNRDTRPMAQAALIAASGAVRTSQYHPDDASIAQIKAALTTALAAHNRDVTPVILACLPAMSPLYGADDAFLEAQLKSAVVDPAFRAAAANSARDILNQVAANDEARTKMSVDLLRSVLKDENPQIRGTAYTTLWHVPAARKLGGDALRTELRSCTQTFIANLADPEPTTREVAAWCLSWTDREDADAALKALKALDSEKEARVKTRIDKAVSQLEAAKSTSADWPEPTWEPFRRRGGFGGR